MVMMKWSENSCHSWLLQCRTTLMLCLKCLCQPCCEYLDFQLTQWSHPSFRTPPHHMYAWHNAHVTAADDACLPKVGMRARHPWARTLRPCWYCATMYRASINTDPHVKNPPSIARTCLDITSHTLHTPLSTPHSPSASQGTGPEWTHSIENKRALY